MENLKRKSVRAYLLLESLISLGLLSALTGIILIEIVNSRQQIRQENQQIEAFNVAKMAVDSQLTELSVNGAAIKISTTTTRTLLLTDHGKELLQLEVQN